MPLQTTVTPFTTGLDSVAGSGTEWSVVFSGDWRDCDRPTIILTDTGTLTQTVLGFGDTNSFTPTFLLTFKDKVYAACDTALAFSAIATPTQFQDKVLSGATDADAPGNGYIVPGNNYGTPESIKSLAIYQDKIAVVNRNSTQVWSMAADPANNDQKQVLENLGTPAPESVKPLGTLDVMMLTDTGVRSLRVRDSSNNAIVVDIGTPIDRDVQADLALLSETEKSQCCAVVEPAANRYWLFVPGANGAEGTIYVLSYFPTANIAAWSTYRPTVKTGAGDPVTLNDDFIPQRFVVKDARVYARTAGALIAYGGSDGNSYEDCGVTVTTPWLDAKSPATRKQSTAIDVSCAGTWTVSLGMDPAAGTLTSAYTKSDATNASSFYDGQVPVSMQGTHFRMQFVEAGSTSARLAGAAFHYDNLNAD